MMDCLFCEILENENREIIWQDENAFAIRDAFPLSPGHSLILPRRCVASFWDCTPEEQGSLLAGAEWVKDDLEIAFPNIAGWNLGVNVGGAAGQTVFHVHLHVVPRFEGDVDDPTGGVRGNMPGQASY